MRFSDCLGCLLLNRAALLAAHRESCVFHLTGAYRCLIWEVAHTYDEPYAGQTALTDFLRQAAEREKSLPELERISALEQSTGSWLQQLLAAWQRINQLEAGARPTVTGAAPAAIDVRSMNEADGFSQLHDWYDNLSNLIEEIRQLLGEW